MVKVREFCCGCSLRSGTFTIAWGVLMYSTLLLIGSIGEFFSQRRRFANYQYIIEGIEIPSTSIFVYNVIRTIVGIAVSTIALWALHKNKVVFLNGLLCYLCYQVASFSLSVTLLIFKPDWEKKLGELNPILRYYNYNQIENILTLLIFYVFVKVILAYLTLIVKSYKDYTLRNEAQNVQFVGPDATTVGYIAA